MTQARKDLDLVPGPPFDAGATARLMATDEVSRLYYAKFKLIDRCNARCPKCNHWRRRGEFPRDRALPLTEPELQRFADQAIEMGTSAAGFSGGEPTLHESLVDLVARLERNGVRTTVTTNALSLTSDLAHRLLSAGLSKMIVSVDGGTDAVHDASVGVPGALRRVREAIAAMSAAGLTLRRVTRLAFNTVVTRRNLDSIVEIVDLASVLGVAVVSLIEVDEAHLVDKLGLEGEEQRYRREILPSAILRGRELGVEVIPEGYFVDVDGRAHRVAAALLAQVPCYSAWDRVTLFPAGDLYVCCESRDPLLHYGNIRDAPLRDLLRSPRSHAVRNVCRAPGLKVAACRSCHIDLARRVQLALALGYRGPIVE